MVEAILFRGLAVSLVGSDHGDTSSAAAEIQTIFDAEKAKSRGVMVLAPASMWEHLAVRGLILPDDPVEFVRVLYDELGGLGAAGYRVAIVALPRSVDLDSVLDRLRRESS